MGSAIASILFAAAAAAGFGLETALFGNLLGGALALNAGIFQCLAAYAVFLAVRFPRLRRELQVLPALLIPAALLPFSGSAPWIMAAPAAAAIACLRSGLAGRGFEGGRDRPGALPARGRLFASELLCTAGGFLLAAALRPPGILGAALAVWLFFLVQALYFLMNAGLDPEAEIQARRDRFERASARAEMALARLAGRRREELP
jgi:hypothetical protein